MKVSQLKWSNHNWQHISGEVDTKNQLCLLFGSRFNIEADIQTAVAQLRNKNPNATVVTASTAGNIADENLIDNTIIATCINLEKTTVKAEVFGLTNIIDEELGKNIASKFDTNNLAYLLILSTTGVNAGNVLKGINSVFQGKVPVSGGIAGDDTRFEKTLVGLNDHIATNQLVAVGFYSNNLIVSHGSKGGWDTFGPIRKVTKCKGNILYEVDNKPVLNLYKEYLGEKAKELPAAGLLFPFAIIDKETKEYIVRGLQNIDETTNSLVLFGDIEEGQNLQLMRANFDNLIDGAGESAKETFLSNKQEPELAILISCVARRLVLGELTEEELTEVKKMLGTKATLCGFYSYSELSPVVGNNACQLHNQTMTITTLSEN